MSELALFEQRQVRRTLLHNEWWFVITDVVSVLTDSANPSDYLKKLRKRDASLAEAFKGGGQLVPPLGLEFDTPGGRQMLQCWNDFLGITFVPGGRAYREPVVPVSVFLWFFLFPQKERTLFRN